MSSRRILDRKKRPSNCLPKGYLEYAERSGRVELGLNLTGRLQVSIPAPGGWLYSPICPTSSLGSEYVVRPPSYDWIQQTNPVWFDETASDEMIPRYWTPPALPLRAPTPWLLLEHYPFSFSFVTTVIQFTHHLVILIYQKVSLSFLSEKKRTRFPLFYLFPNTNCIVVARSDPRVSFQQLSC